MRRTYQGKGSLILDNVEYLVTYRIDISTDALGNSHARGSLEPVAAAVAASKSNSCRLRLESGNEIAVRVEVLNDDVHVHLVDPRQLVGL